jgi:hypothetical protein
MRPDPLEIGIILVVVLLVAVIMRIVRFSRDTTAKGEESSVEIRKQKIDGRRGKGRRYLGLIGTAFILIGLFLLLSGINLFKWVLWSYLWSFIIVSIGFMMVLVSRKK